MLDDDHRDPFLGQLANAVAHRSGLGRGQSCEHLVEQQQFRARGEGSGDLEPAQLGDAQLLGVDVGDVLHADALEHGLRRRLRCSGGAMVREGGHFHVLEHGHAAERLYDLERSGETAPADLMGATAVDAVSLQTDLTRRRCHRARDAIEQGGLAGAVRPDDREDLSRVDGEADVTERLQAAERLAHVAQFQQRRGHDATPGASSPPRRAFMRCRRAMNQPAIPCGRTSASTASRTA